MKHKSFLTILVFSCYSCIYSQSTFEDAKQLVIFQQWYNENKPTAIDPSNALASSAAIDGFNSRVQQNLAELVLAKRNNSPRQAQPNNANGPIAGGAIAQENGAVTNGNSQAVASTGFNNSVVKQIQKEIGWYMAFSEFGNEIFAGKVSNDSLQDFPKSFKYLKTTIDVLENDEQAASFTASAGLGGLMSISQSEILTGITNWALDRAQKELMQAFLNDWLLKLESDPILQQTFPNTLNMLSTKSVTTFFTDGDTWKATFQQDFDGIPKHLPQIVEIALREAGNPIPLKSQQELISGIATTTTLINGIGNNKRPEEILQLLSQEALIRSQPKGVKQVSIIDRTALGMGTLINGLQKGGEKLSFVNPRDILALSEMELQAFWKLLYVRERETLRYAFGLEKGEEEMEFYKRVDSLHLPKLRLKLTQVAENIQGINTMVNKIATQGSDQAFTKESFHTYVTLSFELLELGVTTLETFGVKSLPLEDIVRYRETYFSLFNHVSQIIEGIKTKQYGTVALNTVNLLVWIKNKTINQNFKDVFKEEKYLELVHGDIKKSDIVALSKALNNVAGQHLPGSAADIVKGKLGQFEKALDQEPDPVQMNRAKVLLQANLILTPEEQRTIIGDAAVTAIAKLQNTSEALHKYGNLMVNIVMAEDSEDIENALEVAAMETGGYLIKQNSTFSATISFFPGIEYGREEIKGANGQSGSGSFIGATLPIGAEFSWATGWEKSIGAVGAFVQILDLGAVLNYSLSNDNDKLENNSDFGFKQVLSPGIYFMAHTSNLPITLGAGLSYAPALRKVGVDNGTVDASTLQWGLFIGVDLNVFTLFASDNKISMASRK